VVTVDYYDRNAEQFYRETVNVNMGELYLRFLAYVPEGSSILDAGCGSGRDSLYYLQRGYKVTAFDASKELVALSSQLTGLPVLHLRFQDVEFAHEFDAVWACASLLHVSRAEVDDALARLTKAMKSGGILYASFKYGESEWEKDGRVFNSYDEKSFSELLARHQGLELLQEWTSEDVRRGRNQERWFNVLLRKV
jgi:SAM-dependent methyltransferase